MTIQNPNDTIFSYPFVESKKAKQLNALKMEDYYMKQSESPALDAFLSVWKEKNAKRKLVSQKEYYTWLIGFMVGRGVKYIDTESVLYDDNLTEDNRKKLLAISELFSLIEDFCYKHDIKQKIHEIKKISFPHGEYIIEGDGYYFSIFTMVGQGAITILTMLSQEEATRYADFFIAIDDILK